MIILSHKRCLPSRKSVLLLLVLAPARFARSEASLTESRHDTRKV